MKSCKCCLTAVVTACSMRAHDLECWASVHSAYLLHCPLPSDSEAAVRLTLPTPLPQGRLKGMRGRPQGKADTRWSTCPASALPASAPAPAAHPRLPRAEAAAPPSVGTCSARGHGRAALAATGLACKHEGGRVSEEGAEGGRHAREEQMPLNMTSLRAGHSRVEVDRAHGQKQCLVLHT